MKHKTIYLLTTEDVQKVAESEIGRKLEADEIEKLIEPIAEKISWYEAIADSINETIK